MFHTRYGDYTLNQLVKKFGEFETAFILTYGLLPKMHPTNDNDEISRISLMIFEKISSFMKPKDIISLACCSKNLRDTVKRFSISKEFTEFVSYLKTIMTPEQNPGLYRYEHIDLHICAFELYGKKNGNYISVEQQERSIAWKIRDVLFKTSQFTFVEALKILSENKRLFNFFVNSSSLEYTDICDLMLGDLGTAIDLCFEMEAYKKVNEFLTHINVMSERVNKCKEIGKKLIKIKKYEEAITMGYRLHGDDIYRATYMFSLVKNFIKIEEYRQALNAANMARPNYKYKALLQIAQEVMNSNNPQAEEINKKITAGLKRGDTLLKIFPYF